MQFSIVIPVHNEVESVAFVAPEIASVLEKYEYELIFVDDGSTDATISELEALRGQIPQLRIVRHINRSGQSRAVRTGAVAARYQWVITLDGDGQNDPADIPRLLSILTADPALRLVMGNRVTRRDTKLRRLSSRIANGIRGRLLRDGAPDTGCGLKLMHRQTFLDLPTFDHMHRFLPALFQRAGAKVVSVPVAHRDRVRGRSKYGIHNRLWAGIVDLIGVMWLIRRRFPDNQAIET